MLRAPLGKVRKIGKSNKLGRPSGQLVQCCRTTRLAFLLFVWYTSSLLTSLSTKEILRVFPYPITLAAVQQAIAAAMGWASLQNAGRPRQGAPDGFISPAQKAPQKTGPEGPPKPPKIIEKL